MNPEIEKLIKMALADGQITDKEREIILRKAEKIGLDVDEVEMYLEGSLASNMPNNSSKIIQETNVNLESKPLISEIANTRNFTPKIVKPIEPALLNHENELKLKISELSDSKKVLFDNLENLIKAIKVPHGDLDIKKRDVDKKIYLLQNEFDENSKKYIGEFISEINNSISKKYGPSNLIFKNPEQFIGLDVNEIKSLINKDGLWDSSELTIKRRKYYKLYINLIYAYVFFIVIMFFVVDSSDEMGILLCISFFVIGFLYKMVDKYNTLIEDNKMNFTDENINSIVTKIRKNYNSKFEQLVTLKSQINDLKISQNKLKLKDISEYEIFLSTK